MNSSDMKSSIEIPDKETKGMVQQTRESILGMNRLLLAYERGMFLSKLIWKNHALGRTRHFVLVDDEELSESEEHLEDDYESEDPIETTTQTDFVEELDDDEDEVGFGNSIDSIRLDGFVEEPVEDDDESEPTNWNNTIAHEGWFEESDEEETEEPTTTLSTKPTKQTISTARAWNQCGGRNWKGPKSCESGFDCVAKSVWYSQVSDGWIWKDFLCIAVRTF